MKARIHPIGIEAGQVLHVQLDQRAGQLTRVTQLVREGIGFELELPRQDVHQQLHQTVRGREDLVEEDEADDDGSGIVEAESVVE